MWLIIHKQVNGQSGAATETAYYLLPDMEYSVGRIGCDITTIREQSISKKHAVVIVDQRTLSVKDMSSFGTFVNGNKVHKSVHEIKDGHQIIFGLRGDLSGTYTLRWRPVVLCCSQMVPSQLLPVRTSIISSHITLLDVWDVSVTHLVVGELRTTQKVVCALAKGVPIVGVSWVKCLIEAINKLTPIPLPSDHLPALATACELSDVTLFHSNLKRGKLFEGKRFYFLDSLEFQQLSDPISYCGGTSTLIDVSDVPFATFDRYASPDAAVVSGSKDHFCSTLGGTEFISLLELTVEKAGRNLVQEVEIIHSIINVATERIFHPLPLPLPLPLQLSTNLARREERSQSPAKQELSQAVSGCMLSLFDEENIADLDYPCTQPDNQNFQLSASDKPSLAPSQANRRAHGIANTIIKCELPIESSPPAVPHEEPDATCNTPRWLSCANTDPPAPHQAIQEAVIEAKPGFKILRKCFVKTPSLVSRSYIYIEPFIRVTANSGTLKTEPISSSSDEEPIGYTKPTIASISPLARSQIPTTPKGKRKSSEKSESTQKKSLITIRGDSDSDNDNYLMVTPLT